MPRNHMMGVNANGQKVTNVANPTVATDAANKQYVDSAAAGGGGSWTYVTAGADTENDTTTAVNASGLSISNLPDGLYHVAGLFIVSTAAFAAAPRPGLLWSGTGFTFTPVVFGRIGTNASRWLNVTPSTGALPASVQVDETSHPVGSNVLAPGLNFEAVLRATSMSGSVVGTIAAEIAGTMAYLKADSFMRYLRIGN